MCGFLITLLQLHGKGRTLEGEQSWQQLPPDIGEETVLVRREKDQQQHPSPPGLQTSPDV